MRVLAVDTSTRTLCVGISEAARLYEYNLDVGTKLSSLLAVTLKRLLDYLGWKASDIDYLACGLGPGSFTGVRVGVAAIKGLAWSLNKPVAGISSLDILAKNAPAPSGYVIPVIDAKRSLIYCALYRIEAQALKRITPYMLLSEDEFAKKIKNKIPAGKAAEIFILGDGLDLHRERLLSCLKRATILDKDYWKLRGKSIIELAKEKIKDKKLSTAFEIEPLYLYPKECQIRK